MLKSESILNPPPWYPHKGGGVMLGFVWTLAKHKVSIITRIAVSPPPAHYGYRTVELWGVAHHGCRTVELCAISAGPVVQGYTFSVFVCCSNVFKIRRQCKNLAELHTNVRKWFPRMSSKKSAERVRIRSCGN